MTREELREEVIKLTGNASEQILLIVKSVLELQQQEAIVQPGVAAVTGAKAAGDELTSEEEDAKAVSQMLHHGGQSRDEFEAKYPHLFSK